MNAGRDVERLIGNWLTEEAGVRSPDRVLESARQTIDRTRQRRLSAAWRDPMLISPLRLAGMAAVVAIAVLGAGVIGRMTAPAGAGTQPTQSVAPSGTTATLESYRAARNAVCSRYATAVNPLKPQAAGVFALETSESDRAPKVQVLLEIVRQLESMTNELEELQPPAAMSAAHVANLVRARDVNVLIRSALELAESGDIVGADAVDKATNPLARAIEAFENEHALSHCP